MATTINLTANRRSVLGRQVGALRRSGKLPAVLYGSGVETTPIELDGREATRILARLSGTHLIDLSVDGAVHKALVREIQRDFIRGDLLHVDFLAVAMDRLIRVTVPINLVGEAPAATEGVLVNGVTEIEIECLPGNILSKVEVDMSSLKAIGDSLHVRDITVPANVEVLSDPDDLVVRVTPLAAEEVAPVETPAGLPEVEVIERGKKEEEGEAAEE
jgi:large subunit ribosomal protein L25